jgi:chromosome segregation ATPase
MCRKIGFVALAGMIALAVLTFTRAGSYSRTTWNKISTTVQNQIPVEFEIERLRQEVNQLVPDMKKNRSMVAEEMVAVENLREEIATSRANLDRQKADLMAIARDVENGESQVTYNSRTYSAERIKDKLARDLAGYKRSITELKAREQLLDAKERALDVAKEQLTAMLEQKRELEVHIAQLEAELKTVRLAQTKSQFALDDSRLSEIKRSIADLRNRLKVEITELELEGVYGSDPTVRHEKTKPASDVAREVLQYFGGAQ